MYTAVESEGKVELSIVITNPSSGALIPITFVLTSYDTTAGIDNPIFLRYAHFCFPRLSR